MRTTLILAGLALALAGCNETGAPADDAGASQMEPAGSVAEPAGNAHPTSTARPQAVGPDFRHDTEIPKNQIDTNLVLAAPPAYRPSDDTLVLQVEVQNRGRSALVGKGKFPVQLAAMLAGPDGVDEAPGRRNFVRAPLPLIRPGGSSTVTVNVPAEEILGLGLKLELLQEGAAWFGRRYGQPVLDVGTFQRCDGAAGTLCDATGAPVRTITGQESGPADASAGSGAAS